MPSDFTSILESGIEFSPVELDEGVDFIDTGDAGQIIISGQVGFGEGGFGEGGFGGDITTLILNVAQTSWTSAIETDSEFTPTGDAGQIIVSGSTGFGEGGFGEGGFGGDAVTLILNGAETIWTDIDTP